MIHAPRAIYLVECISRLTGIVHCFFGKLHTVDVPFTFSGLTIIGFGSVLEFSVLFPGGVVCGSAGELLLLAATSPKRLITTHGRPISTGTTTRGMDPGDWTFWIKVSSAGLGVLLSKDGLVDR